VGDKRALGHDRAPLLFYESAVLLVYISHHHAVTQHANAWTLTTPLCSSPSIA